MVWLCGIPRELPTKLPLLVSRCLFVTDFGRREQVHSSRSVSLTSSQNGLGRQNDCCSLSIVFPFFGFLAWCVGNEEGTSDWRRRLIARRRDPHRRPKAPVSSVFRSVSTQFSSLLALEFDTGGFGGGLGFCRGESTVITGTSNGGVIDSATCGWRCGS